MFCFILEVQIRCRAMFISLFSSKFVRKHLPACGPPMMCSHQKPAVGCTELMGDAVIIICWGYIQGKIKTHSNGVFNLKRPYCLKLMISKKGKTLPCVEDPIIEYYNNYENFLGINVNVFSALIQLWELFEICLLTSTATLVYFYFAIALS